MFKKVVQSPGCGAKKPVAAFSLVEMLMALLVASLLMAALAPVMTKKLNDSMTVSVEGTIPGKKTKTDIIDYDECIKRGGNALQEKDASGKIVSEYCEGTFDVPVGFNGNMTVTAIGAGGGGGAAATAGYTEYTTAGSTGTFTVPLMVNRLEATLISGGAGGGAGGQVLKSHTFVTTGSGNYNSIVNAINDFTSNPDGMGTWKVPNAVKNNKANMIVTACGGGGGGGAGPDAVWKPTTGYGYGGGSGGYIHDVILNLNNLGYGDLDTISYILGGGGGGGGGAYSGNAQTGTAYGGGAGGGGPHGGAFSSFIQGHLPNGGDGAPLWSVISADKNAKDVTTNAGAAGKGIYENEKPPGVTSKVYTNGGSGGKQGGGGGGSAHWPDIYVGGSGGGGGATQILANSNVILTIPGGGGGTGVQRDLTTTIALAGGGGGGGIGGGAGGSLNSNNGKGGQGGKDGNGINGGIVSGQGPYGHFTGNDCSGGNGGNQTNSSTAVAGNSGKTGAIRLTYLSFGTGGSGGGSGRIFAIYPVNNFTESEKLKIIVGVGGAGGTAGYMDNSGKIIEPIEPNCSHAGGTYITKENGDSLVGTPAACNAGGWYGLSSGVACGPNVAPYSSEGGWIYSILGTASPINGGMSGAYPKGFFSANGNSAGYPTGQANLNCNADSIAIETSGGRGAYSTTPFTGTCTPGNGGTSSSPKGKDASGYGCGGGGGYGLADGGAGSGGYARISWNKYWNVDTNDYDLNTVGAGGGGASGNIEKHTVSVKSGEKIKYRVGKGGNGAYIVTTSTAALTDATNGGDTIFAYGTSKAVKAGGGGYGGSPSIVNNALVNGAAGNVSSVCHFYTSPDSSGCNRGNNTGANPVEAKGGNGASLSVSDYGGKGGTAKAPGRGDTNGGDGTGYGTGGAGASLVDLDAITPSNAATNPTRGGAGANGVIIITWDE